MTTYKPRRTGPLWADSQYRDTKDPCPVYDGHIWHLYGSGGSSLTEEWSILHAVSETLDGPWEELPPVQLVGVSGGHVAAPGVVFDGERFHMFVQTEFMGPGGTVEYLTAPRPGTRFRRVSTVLPSTAEAVYDPHPATVKGRKVLTYSAGPATRPDIHLAFTLIEAGWDGPWATFGPILHHKQVELHNQHDHVAYEWGLEGSQIVQLPSGLLLLIFVGFLPHGAAGTRQRVFFAYGKKVTGPFHVSGVALDPGKGWDSGENGHPAGVLHGGDLVLFYQGKGPGRFDPWRYGQARFEVAALERVGWLTLRFQKQLGKVAWAA